MLELFKRILADPDMQLLKPRLKEHEDLKNLIEFILKKFFKAVEKNPFLIVEVSSRLLRCLRVRTDEI